MGPEAEGVDIRCPVGEQRARIVEGMLRRCVTELETMIREAPEQWAWIHPRWEPAALVRSGAARSGLLVALVAFLGVGAGCGQKKAPAVVASPKRVDTGPEATTQGFTTRESFTLSKLAVSEK